MASEITSMANVALAPNTGPTLIEGGGGAPVDAANRTFQEVIHAVLHSAL
jgi:hypothetical protein